jgi:hypothetical protein
LRRRFLCSTPEQFLFLKKRVAQNILSWSECHANNRNVFAIEHVTAS